MKKIFLTSIFAGLLIVTSCKNDQKEKEVSEKSATPFFYAEVDVEAAQKDDFALYYTEDNSVNFNGDLAEWSGTKGGNAKETITFKLREDKFPTNIRLDFGINKAQDSVKVYQVKIGYQDRSFTIPGAAFFTYFINNEKDFSASIDQKSGALKIVKKESTYNTPYFYPTEELNKKIKEITTGKP